MLVHDIQTTFACCSNKFDPTYRTIPWWHVLERMLEMHFSDFAWTWATVTGTVKIVTEYRSSSVNYHHLNWSGRFLFQGPLLIHFSTLKSL